MASGGYDGLAQHLTALDYAAVIARAIVSGCAHIATIAVRSHVEYVDQVVHVAPRGEALCGAVAFVGPSLAGGAGATVG